MLSELLRSEALLTRRKEEEFSGRCWGVIRCTNRMHRLRRSATQAAGVAGGVGVLDVGAEMVWAGKGPGECRRSHRRMWGKCASDFHSAM